MHVTSWYFHENSLIISFLFKECFTSSSVSPNDLEEKRENPQVDEKPYHCEFCEYCASRKSTLSNHLLIHSGDKPFKCDLCDYCAADKSALTRHLRTHSDDKPFKCPLCDYCASEKSTLTKHLWTHSDDKPFKCEFCEYSTKTSQGLLQHKKSQHPDIIFSCIMDNCTFETRDRYKFNEHMEKVHFHK